MNTTECTIIYGDGRLIGRSDMGCSVFHAWNADWAAFYDLRILRMCHRMDPSLNSWLSGRDREIPVVPPITQSMVLNSMTALWIGTTMVSSTN